MAGKLERENFKIMNHVYKLDRSLNRKNLMNTKRGTKVFTIIRLNVGNTRKKETQRNKSTPLKKIMIK